MIHFNIALLKVHAYSSYVCQPFLLLCNVALKLNEAKSVVKKSTFWFIKNFWIDIIRNLRNYQGVLATLLRLSFILQQTVKPTQ